MGCRTQLLSVLGRPRACRGTQDMPQARPMGLQPHQPSPARPTSGRLHRSSFLSACTCSLHCAQYQLSSASSCSGCRKDCARGSSGTRGARHSVRHKASAQALILVADPAVQHAGSRHSRLNAKRGRHGCQQPDGPHPLATKAPEAQAATLPAPQGHRPAAQLCGWRAASPPCTLPA